MPAIEEETGSSSGLSLAIRLQGGSAEAWRELVDLYGPLVESWCARAGLAASSRADVGQEVFLAVHRGIARFNPTHPRATFRGWLWTITRNAVLAWRRRREPVGRGGSTAEGQLAQLPDSWTSASSDEPPPRPTKRPPSSAARPPNPPHHRTANLECLLEHGRPRPADGGSRGRTGSHAGRHSAGKEPDSAAFAAAVGGSVAANGVKALLACCQWRH